MGQPFLISPLAEHVVGEILEMDNVDGEGVVLLQVIVLIKVILLGVMEEHVVMEIEEMACVKMKLCAVMLLVSVEPMMLIVEGRIVTH